MPHSDCCTCALVPVGPVLRSEVCDPSGLVACDDKQVCDVSSLESVRSFVAAYKESGKPCHVLINNAGVMVGAVVHGGCNAALLLSYCC